MEIEKHPANHGNTNINTDTISVLKSLSPEEEQMSLNANKIYAALRKSSIIPKIFKQVYGNDAPPEEVSPLGFVTKRDLERCVEAVLVKPGMTLLDLACGGGGPGLWIARQTGANLVGIDFSTIAIELATKRAVDFGLGTKAIYKHGSMAVTGLPTGTFDAVVSIDALWNATDKPAVLQEIKRLLRPNGRFVFTTWEQRAPDGADLPPNLCYRAMLQNAGFKVIFYEETANWEKLQREVYRRWLLSRETFFKEMGEQVTELLLGEATKMTVILNNDTDQLSQIHRIFIVAHV